MKTLTLLSRFLLSFLLLISLISPIKPISAEDPPEEPIIIEIDEIIVKFDNEEFTFDMLYQNLQLTPIIQNIEGDYSLVYSSTNPEIADVDSNGLVTSLDYGETTITLVVNGEYSAQCLVKVNLNEENLQTVTLVKPAKVTNLILSGNTVSDSYTQLQIDFSILSDVVGYQIYRSTKKSSGFKLVGYAYSNSFLDTNLKAGVKYYYKVRGFNSNGSTTVYGAYSSVVSKKTVAIPISKVAKLTKFTYSTSVRLDFAEVSDATGYQIYRSSKKNGKYKKVVTTSTNSGINSSLTNGKNYYYKVRAYRVHNGVTYYGSFSAKLKAKPTRIVKYKNNFNSSTVVSTSKSLATKFPDLIKYKGIIGKSVKGKDIPYFTVGNGPQVALLVGGMHAREHLGTNFIFRTIEDYAVYYTNGKKYSNYDMQVLFSKYTIYVVPNCNPDGLDIVTKNAKPTVSTGLGKNHVNYKNNARGVNLNRNFDYLWLEGKSKSNVNKPNIASYYGPAAASEPETQALVNLCDTHNFAFMLSMHHMGNVVYYGNPKNLSYTKSPGSNHYELAKAIKSAAGFGLAKIDSMSLTLYAGCFEDWFTDRYRKPGFCIELVPSKAAKYMKPTSKKGNNKFNTLTNWSSSRYLLAAAMAYEFK